MVIMIGCALIYITIILTNGITNGDTKGDPSITSPMIHGFVLVIKGNVNIH